MSERFSERIGAQIPPKIVQLEGMSDDLRNSLWNIVVFVCDANSWVKFSRFVAMSIRKTRIDEVPDGNSSARAWLKSVFLESEWFIASDIIEALSSAGVLQQLYESDWQHRKRQEGAIHALNHVLERERSGYRFIDGTLSPIAEPQEVAEVESALSATSSGFHGARSHLATALEMLGKRPEPDYRNAVKEAVSAVESVCRVLTNKDKATLGDALKALDSRSPIHPALKRGFLSIYGYTSDQDGIRQSATRRPRPAKPLFQQIHHSLHSLDTDAQIPV
jgi:hypothetical protein